MASSSCLGKVQERCESKVSFRCRAVGAVIRLEQLSVLRPSCGMVTHVIPPFSANMHSPP
jgi:hypothetical protein